MTAPFARAPWLLAALLAFGVAAELARPPGNTAGPATTPALPRAIGGAVPGEPAADYAAAMLARPLFAADRRPEAGNATPGPLASLRPEPPRLAGILLTATGRSAIFAAAAGGHGTVVKEGGSVGPWRVDAIHAGDVLLTGPEGLRTVRPAYSDAPVASGSPEPPLPLQTQADTRPFNGLPAAAGAANLLNAPVTPAARIPP